MEFVRVLRSKLGEAFKGYDLRPHIAGKSRVFITIDRSANRDATKILWSELGARFNTISGVDLIHSLALVYHFIFDSDGLVVSLKLNVPTDSPEVDTISDIIPAAAFIEREVHDLFGVKFRGHPNLKKWIIADDWPEGVYPLRKDWQPPE